MKKMIARVINKIVPILIWRQKCSGKFIALPKIVLQIRIVKSKTENQQKTSRENQKPVSPIRETGLGYCQLQNKY
jgi:hypothetical protein